MLVVDVGEPQLVGVPDLVERAVRERMGRFGGLLWCVGCSGNCGHAFYAFFPVIMPACAGMTISWLVLIYNCASILSAPLTSNLPGASRLNCFTTPSSTSIE